MPKVDDAKIKSARSKRSIALWSLGVAAALFAVLAPTIFYQPPTAEVQLAGKTISLEIASSQAARERGLSGRESLPNDKGMLFVVASPKVDCYWMKGMQFSLDMVWLNSAKQVVYMQQNVSPKTYPKSFCPPSPTKYVIELGAGQAKQLGIHTGQTLKF